jgi:hypothetical protein
VKEEENEKIKQKQVFFLSGSERQVQSAIMPCVRGEREGGRERERERENKIVLEQKRKLMWLNQY